MLESVEFIDLGKEEIKNIEPEIPPRSSFIFPVPTFVKIKNKIHVTTDEFRYILYRKNCVRYLLSNFLFHSGGEFFLNEGTFCIMMDKVNYYK